MHHVNVVYDCMPGLIYELLNIVIYLYNIYTAK